MIKSGETIFLPDLVYTGGRFRRGLALVCDDAGRIMRLARAGEIAGRVIRLNGRALLPGLVNAHSHAFQRVIRGRTEHRTGQASDTFWTWREMMYSAATRLTPEDMYDASRMAFLEMALAGITSVGEFHYVHRAPDGAPYDDPNLMAKEVVRAARDVGLRIALLRVAYARSGYRKEPNPRQARFIESKPEDYLQNVEKLKADLARTEDAPQRAWVGVAPHSVRAVPLDYLREVIRYGNQRAMPVHMHVAEQPAEIAACMEEHRRTPVRLLADEALLSARFTGVHGIHLTPEEVQCLARARAMICACPTTERNLGDGIVPADALMEAGVRLSLGTDSHTQIDLLEDARELEYHLRLARLERNVLAAEANASSESDMAALAARLFTCATLSGAQSIGAPGGELEPGRTADFFTVDLDDPSIAGASTDDLLACLVFSLARTAVREVYIGGRAVIEDGRQRAQTEIVEKFNALQSRLWG
jgi:formimidoylglutamate deiminase